MVIIVSSASNITMIGILLTTRMTAALAVFLFLMILLLMTVAIANSVAVRQRPIPTLPGARKRTDPAPHMLRMPNRRGGTYYETTAADN